MTASPSTAPRTAAADPLIAPRRRESISEIPPGPVAVLIVENDPDTQSRLAKTLTRRGHTVIGTCSADGALALQGVYAVDLAFVAEDLPGMDGQTLVAALRHHAPQLPIVLMTSEGPEAAVAALAIGATAHLDKPVSSEALTGCLARLTGRPVQVVPAP